MEQQPRPPPALTTAVSWRSEGIKYRKNEVFLDVIENVNVLVRLSLSLASVPFVAVVCACASCVRARRVSLSSADVDGCGAGGGQRHGPAKRDRG